MSLSADFERDGFAVVPGVKSVEECRALIERADSMMRAFDLEHRSVFTTNEQDRDSDAYFLASGANVSFFFEPDSFDETGELIRPIEESINKVGHALHDLDPAFDAFSRGDSVAMAAAAVGLREPLLLQSMYLCKQPFIGGEVHCHQDATFLYTDPITVTGFWFALEDADTDNGCLWVQPGGHQGPLRKLFKRDGLGTVFETLDDAPLPNPPAGLVPVEAEAGTMVILHGLLPHWSDVNRSHRSRHAYSVHCIEAAADYPAWNWLQRDLPLRGF